jgi:hypothetical protein
MSFTISTAVASSEIEMMLPFSVEVSMTKSSYEDDSVVAVDLFSVAYAVLLVHEVRSEHINIIAKKQFRIKKGFIKISFVKIKMFSRRNSFRIVLEW